MKILVLEDNLIWSGRIAKTLEAEGHEPTVVTGLPENPDPYDLAIVNLSSQNTHPFESARELKELGIPILAHAGHKEKELWDRGREVGCDRIVSNGEFTYKLPAVLKEFE